MVTESSQSSDPGTGFLRAARSGNLDKMLEYLKANVDINTSNANGLNALHLASKDGHVHVVEELLKRGAQVDAATRKGNTALHIAALAGQEDVVRLLTKNGAHVNVQSQNGFTPLYMAAQENHDHVVKFLLGQGANQSLSTEDGFTPLAVAMQQGHDKVVALLLESDVRGKVRLPALHIAAKKDDCKAARLLLLNSSNPDVTSKSNFTPLHIAAHYGNHEVAALLLDRGADVNFPAKHQITPLHVAAKWGKSHIAALLLDRGSSKDSKTRDGLTPLHCAARSGHEQLVDLLLEKGAPISSKTKNGLAPLHMAAQGDHVDAARILLFHKAPVDDVTVDYLTALHVAAHCGHVRVAKLLLERKADPNSRALNGFTPLHIACKKNRIKVVELLMKCGANIETTTESGLTPLHVASFMGCMNIAIFLLQNGAKPDASTVRGETPLHLAARANQTDIVRILLRNGATVDCRAREEQTPLHIAARLGNCDLVMLLLQHGASVDAATKEIYTALHVAAKEGQEEVVSILLDKGADVSAGTKRGFTPLHLAAKHGHVKVATLLINKGAPIDAEGKNGLTPLHVATHHDHNALALLLLENGANPNCAAKNGYTPLHVAAKRNQIEVVNSLLEHGVDVGCVSRAGFTPIHLASQEGHAEMVDLLLKNGAVADAEAKNGLRSLHLAAQEDCVSVATVLVCQGNAEVDPATHNGYTPLHVASHFGQAAMVRYLLQNGANVHCVTSSGYTPLHHAAQQGQTLIITLLLEKRASPDAMNSAGQTPLAIAEKLGYVSVVETLKIVTTSSPVPPIGGSEERYKVLSPESMTENLASDSEDEGTDDAGNESYRYLTVDDMKSLGDDSLPIDVTRDEHHQRDSSYINTDDSNITSSSYQPLTSDNVAITKSAVQIGFLVSFMVDARGGAMRGCRHSGVRIIIPPKKATSPMRVTCRYLKKDRLVHPPPLMEGESLASRILELGPAGAKFLGPVVLEIPHFASLRSQEREIVVLRSDNGDSWREHSLEVPEETIKDVLNESFGANDFKQPEDSRNRRITRILTSDFPQYFALVSRIRQEVHAVGPEGGMVSSSVVPQVQAVFPAGALTKRIKVGLQAHPISSDLINRVAGSRVSASPIVTVEPRRRKFHKPITLTIPVPKCTDSNSALRLLCSITGGTTRAQWEDVTASTPLTFVNDSVSFTTTVSARFWLIDCRHASQDVTRLATDLYREAINVPFMAKFVVFAKRIEKTEARIRVFCMTDDREEKTLEGQENFTEVAKSRDVEVLDGKSQWIDLAGNLTPIAKSGEQLRLKFHSFRENRLPFLVRVRDINSDPVARITFTRDPKSSGKGDQNQVCNLNIVLPARILPDEPSAPQSISSSPRLPLRTNQGVLKSSPMTRTNLLSFEVGQIHKADLKISDIANLLGTDWVILAEQLGIDEADIAIIESEYPSAPHQQATVMLRLWMQQSGDSATGNSLEKALNAIGRTDILSQCIGDVAPVTDNSERILAHTHVDLVKKREATRTHQKKNLSLDVCFDEQDIMKDSESVEDVSQAEHTKTQAKFTSASPDDYGLEVSDPMVSSYERDEQKYVAEEKVLLQTSQTPERKIQPPQTLIDEREVFNMDEVTAVATSLVSDIESDIMKIDLDKEREALTEDRRIIPAKDDSTELYQPEENISTPEIQSTPVSGSTSTSEFFTVKDDRARQDSKDDVSRQTSLQGQAPSSSASDYLTAHIPTSQATSFDDGVGQLSSDETVSETVLQSCVTPELPHSEHELDESEASLVEFPKKSKSNQVPEGGTSSATKPDDSSRVGLPVTLTSSNSGTTVCTQVETTYETRVIGHPDIGDDQEGNILPFDFNLTKEEFSQHLSGSEFVSKPIGLEDIEEESQSPPTHKRNDSNINVGSYSSADSEERFFEKPARPGSESSNSLHEFENLESALCQEDEKKEEPLLSEIEEGQESQLSESEWTEMVSEHDSQSSDLSSGKEKRSQDKNGSKR